MMRQEKPMLDIDGQIKHLQSKGIKFNRITVEEATTYLRENNNYFKLRAYRKNFPKHPDGTLKGQYKAKLWHASCALWHIKGQRDSQLKNERMRQIITLLYAHTVFVTSKGVREHRINDLDDLVSRMYRHINYYDGNENILASFEFFKNTVDILFH